MNTCKLTFRIQPQTINRQRRTHNRTDVKNNKKTERIERLQRCQLMHSIVSNQIHRVHIDGVICPRRRHSWGESVALFLLHTVHTRSPSPSTTQELCFRNRLDTGLGGNCQPKDDGAVPVVRHFEHAPPLPRAFAPRHTLMSHRQVSTSPRNP